jgi:hypothetical protein
MQKWAVGTEPKGNLLGTIRTLDGANGSVPLYCPSMTADQISENHCGTIILSLSLLCVCACVRANITRDSPPMPFRLSLRCNTAQRLP